MAAPEDLVAFCAREHPRLVGALSLYCGDAGVAEELAQEALERVCARWGRVRDMQSPGAWAHRVAMNLAKSHYRRRRAEQRAHRAVGKVDDSVQAPDVAAAVTVRRAVAGLPPRQRAAVVLRFFAGFSVEEAADVLGVRPGALKALTHRAMRALRADLGVGDPDMEANDVR